MLSAKINQMSGGYLPDAWEMTTLRKGDLVYGGLPVQTSYYTDLDAVLASHGDKAIFGRNLQVEMHPIKGYRANIGQYEVLRDIRIPKGLVLENPQLGPGGTTQYFIKNYSHLLDLKHEYTLEEFYESQLSPRNFSP